MRFKKKAVGRGGQEGEDKKGRTIAKNTFLI
jgi:hypothetical protein